MPKTLSPDTAVASSLGGDAATPSDTLVEHLPPITHLTPAERVARGKAAGSRSPWRPTPCPRTTACDGTPSTS